MSAERSTPSVPHSEHELTLEEQLQAAQQEAAFLRDQLEPAKEAFLLVRRLRNVGFTGLVASYWNEEADRVLNQWADR